MERLMVVKLASQGCTAELWLNGLPVARVTPLAPDVVVPVHEAAVTGRNRLELVIGPDTGAAAAAALLQTAPQAMVAQAHLLLPRMNTAVDEAASRSLARLDWACAAGEPLSLPARQIQEVDLPIRFPRWRWLDAPIVAVTPALTGQAHAFVAMLQRDLARGQTESFMTATRLRTEELALAYQRSPDSESARLREWLEQLYAGSRLVWQPLELAEMQLRPLVGGRLLECLATDGRAALTTVPDKTGDVLALPLRVSMVEGRFYVLR